MEKDVENFIAPPLIEISSHHLRIGERYAKTVFIFTYPKNLSSGWFSPIIDMPNLLDIAIFVHPVDTALALKNLRRKATQVASQIQESESKGMVRDPLLEAAERNIEDLRDSLQQSAENLFRVGVYITIYADNLQDLERTEASITSLLEGRLVFAKPAAFQAVDGWTSTLPICLDKLQVHTSLNTQPLISFFPFIAANLTSDSGILYGINQLTNSLIIFDRFSLENANMVIFAKSGSGKSYLTKLETLRHLMFGTDILIIDPENEYENLCRAVGGSFFKISLTSSDHINPFDIPKVPAGDDPSDVLKSHIADLAALLKLMLGGITPAEDSVLDRALIEVYASRDIVPGKDFSSAEPPILEDLETVLRGIEGGADLAERLYKYTKGSYAGFTNERTTIDVNNRMIVFSIRDLESELRPVAMFIILNFIWNLIRAELKKRMLIVEEAWLMMKNPDSAQFLFGLVKRARKYFLGVTTVTQDVEDFLSSPYGKPIITNSSLQILLKQAAASIDIITKTFSLSEGEKQLLLEVPVGEGLFIAGAQHAPIHVVASYPEDRIITTRPEDVLAQQGG